MNTKAICALMSFALLTACASPSHLSKSNKLHTKKEVFSKDINSLINGGLSKKSGNSGSKKIDDPAAAFYKDIPGCESGDFRLRDLMVGEVRVSNNDLSTVYSSLDVMGYSVINLQDPGYDKTARYNCDDLPVIIRQSLPEKLKLSFSDATAEGNNNSTIVNSLGHSNAGELDRFLAYYHPDRVSAYEKLNWLVANKLDSPSAQVYIETMVLEVREEDSKDFGLQYSEGQGDELLSLGSLIPGGDTLSWVKDTFTDPSSGLQVFTPGVGKRLQIKALIESGNAEILSRPSVLAVSNRQAVIQIVDVIQTPQISSTLSETGGLQVSAYEFSPLLVGITLNLKPRVSGDRKWLTLEIDATVDSEDDQNTGHVYAPTTTGSRVLLAEKQGSSSKKVRTFARIPDRTPIIIGGLVGKSKEEIESKIPILGHIPILGRLFTSTDTEYKKREIIIVLTPYILAEDATGIASNQPNASITNRLTDSLLFDNKYRIKNDDLFDLSFFNNDETFKKYRNKALAMVNARPELKTQSPFNLFIKNDIPGSHHLINKMLYDIVDKAGLDSRINTSDITYSNKDKSNNNLKDALEKGGKNLLLKQSSNGAFYKIISEKKTNNKSDDLLISLSSKANISRLKKAIVVRDILAMNNGYNGLAIEKLHTGKELLIPSYSKGQLAGINRQAMEIYLDSRSYYQSVLKSVDQAYQKLNRYPDAAQPQQMSYDNSGAGETTMNYAP